MTALGRDGCKSGWVAARIAATGRRHFHILRHIVDVAPLAADMTMIDIPIGLPDTGYRACERAAREVLGRARSRVFLGARRPLLDLRDDYDRANAWAKTDGKGISQQLFFILPKIAEVDALLLSAAVRQDVFRESHPELIFQRLNGGHFLPNKKTADERTQRRNLVASQGFDDIDHWLGQLSGTGAKADDLLDACACAIAALDALTATGRKLASAEEVDSRGLRMEMWF
ncbi:MAG: DUF429 domain-containing protein [Rhodospirillales bacterium]|nr:DUF429 domain-containing protein [Rhodospirillales bacterium]